MKDQWSGDQLSLNLGSSATTDPNVNSRGSIVGGSIVGGSIVGGSIVGDSIVAVPLR